MQIPSPYQPDETDFARRTAFKRRNRWQANIYLAIAALVLYCEWRANPKDGIVQRNIDKFLAATQDYAWLMPYTPVILLLAVFVYFMITMKKKSSRLEQAFQGSDAPTEAGAKPFGETKPTRKDLLQYFLDAANRSQDQYLAGKMYKVDKSTDWLQLIVIVVVGIALALHYLGGSKTATVVHPQPQQIILDANPNSLSLATPGASSYSLTVVPPIDLGKATKAQILNARRTALQQIEPNYTPYAPIFDGIVDQTPWWGIYGLQFYGPGDRSIEGPSFRSASLLNPLALLWPSLWEQTFHNAHLWRPEKIAAVPGQDRTFPTQAKAQIDVNPAERLITLHVQASQYNTALAPYLRLAPGNHVLLNFEAVNARDLGYPFIWMDKAKSKNITNALPNIFLQDAEFYHVGGSCGYAGGCNNLSPRQEALSGFVIGDLPAIAEFKLWHEPPADPVTATADLTYRIYFE